MKKLSVVTSPLLALCLVTSSSMAAPEHAHPTVSATHSTATTSSSTKNAAKKAIKKSKSKKKSDSYDEEE